jgi:hypothetical protein
MSEQDATQHPVGWDPDIGHWPYPEGTPGLVDAMRFARAWAAFARLRETPDWTWAAHARGPASPESLGLDEADCAYPARHRDCWRPHPSTGRAVCMVCHPTPEVAA